MIKYYPIEGDVARVHLLFAVKIEYTLVLHIEYV